MLMDFYQFGSIKW